MHQPHAAHSGEPLLAQDRFREIAARNANSTALVFGGSHLSYQDLDRSSDLLAHRLVALDIGPEKLVAVHLERSIEMVLSLLAIWKAGAAYLPLDPRHPQDRLNFLLKDAAVSRIITHRALADRLPASSPPHLLIDAALEAEETVHGAQGPPGPPLTSINPSNRAYVIYTSGSTGRPKGVELSHRGLSHLIAAQGPVFEAGPGARILQFSPLSFDASLFEIVMALMHGATLHLASQEALMPGPGLLDLLQREQISHLTIPPSALAALPEGDLPRLRTLACAGEACPQSLVERFAPGRQFFNLYGPTESTVWTTGTQVEGNAEPTLGTAIPGLAVRVMDRALQLVTDGDSGELCIAGVGLARGYLGRPGLTAEKFVPNPEAQEPGERLYRSGDRVCRDTEGDLSFLGRIDRQTKIRGQRIELGEIETVLRRHPEVADCAVLAREDSPGNRRLVAWWVAEYPELPPSATTLRTFLKERLSDAMIPAAFVAVEAFPLTTHGKVDHNALPDPGPERPDLDGDFRTPESPTERTVARLFGELLDVTPVGLDDHFFELGGHSLLVARLAAGLHGEVGVTVPLEHLFAELTVAELAALVDRLASADPLDPSSSNIDPPRPMPRKGPPPPSSAQERVWFLQRMHPTMVAYHASAVVHFRGAFRRPVLVAALEEMVRRHEVLRTTWPELDGEPVQKIHPPWKVELPLIDLSALPPDLKQRTAQRLMLKTMRQRFDMARLPLLRWLLLRFGAEDHRLLQVEHHLIHDGWSFNVMLAEILHLYRAFGRGAPSPLPAPALQFADFALWQRQFAASPAAERQLDYWREVLSDTQTLELPFDRPRPPQQSFEGRTLRSRLDTRRADALRALARRHDASLFMVQLTAFFTLLHRVTGQSDLAIGSAIANRRFPSVEGLLGMILNNLVLRADLAGTEGEGKDGEPSFLECLERVRRTTLGAYSHQDVPFDRVVEAVAPERIAGRNPLFQVMFGFHDSPLEDVELDDLEVEVEPALSNHTAKFDLALVSLLPREQFQGQERAEAAGAIDLLWERNIALFDETTVRRFDRSYRNLLDGVLEDPHVPIDQLPLIAPAERHQMLREWNDTAVPSSTEIRLVERFALWARRQPHAVAVSAGDRTLTYGELLERSQRLAGWLQEVGVGPEVRVALALERSIELVLAQVAVLTAGGAFIGLDPSVPQDRLTYMLEDSQAGILLTHPHLAADLAAPGRTVLPLNQDNPTPLQEVLGGPEGIPKLPVSGETLAYVLYTSGSTGRPKGTLLYHSGLENLVEAHQREYQVTSEDRAAQVGGPGFDVVVWDIWPYLSAGASLHVPTQEVATDPARVMKWLKRQRITYTYLPTPLTNAILEQSIPSSLRVLPPPPEWTSRTERNLRGEWERGEGGEGFPAVEHRPQESTRGGAAGLLTLRYLATGGERLHQRPDASFPCPVINNYGPTETFVLVTRSTVQRWGQGLPPIGRPISNQRLYIADRRLQALPMGAAGELLIAGLVGRGYLNRPALTAERFVPDPFSGVGARLYRSGDRVRFLADGQIDFLGRLDRQVKVRGMRVEVGEVESVLSRHPAVLRAAVVAREDHGSPQLVAYVEWWPEKRETVEDLRQYLRGCLLEAMVPAVFVELETLPLNANGKLDRKALPVPEREATSQEKIPPRNPVEKMVSQIWGQVLELDEIGVHDDFFALGGHSLLGMRVLARLREAFEVDLPLSLLFEHPTVAELAAQAAEGLQEKAGRDEIPLRPRTRDDGPPMLSFAQERLWLIDRLTPWNAAYNMARSFDLRGQLDGEALLAALRTVAGRQEALRTRFPRGEDGRARLVIDEETTAAFAHLDLSHLAHPEKALAEFEQREVRHSFDLATGPLWRVTLVQLAPRHQVLFILLHHIIADGASLDVLFQELETFYNAFNAGNFAALPERPVSSSDVARWQRQRLTKERLSTSLKWWTEELRGAPEVLDLPTDRPRPAEQGFRGAQEKIFLSPDLAKGLEDLGRAHQATPFMLRLAAFAALLARHSGQDDLVIGTPVTGRGRQELEGLIGFFVSSLPLRFQLADDPTFEELLQRTRATTLAAHEHQDLPFERLVEEIAPRRHTAHTPIFQVMFGYDPAGRVPDLSGLEVSPRLLEREEARFDLEMHVVEDPAELDGQRAVLHFDRDLFNGATIRRLLLHYRALLTAAVANPSLRLSQLPLLSPAERHQVAVELADQRTDFGAELTLAELFEDVARRLPHRAAVEMEDRVLSYGELARRAHRLAHHLVAHGVEPETPVGVCLPPSVDRAVAVTAILCAGGAYLTLDPTWPAERLELLLTDTAAAAVICRAELASSLNSPAQVIVIDRDQDAIDRRPTTAPTVNSHAGQLAYITYTSGSTGRPKGVAIPQRAVVRLLRRTNYMDFTAGERIGHAANLAFDAATFELWGALLFGGQVVAVPQETVLQPKALARHIVRHRISTLFLTTALFQQVVRQTPSAFAPLRTLLFGGEACDPAVVRRLVEGEPPERLLHVYGPTECTTYATWHRVEQVPPDTATVPIGIALANTTAPVLDRRGEPVPPGLAGELFLGGAGLARGYFKQPARTAERFIPAPPGANPHGEPGARLYKTGDRVCRNARGEIEFLGRADQQVKIRGFRIEPGEVEHVLADLKGVAQAVVAVRPSTAGERRLVAWYTAENGRAHEASEVRAELARRLPAYMVPTACTRLEKMPLNNNGKVDRKALPDPMEDSVQATPEPPKSAEEEQVAAIWRAVLRLDTVGVHDNFFDLGGHSLLLSEVHTRLETELAADLRLIELFKYPTIHTLAQRLRPADPETETTGAAVGTDRAHRRGTRRTARAARKARRQQHRGNRQGGEHHDG